MLSPACLQQLYSSTALVPRGTAHYPGKDVCVLGRNLQSPALDGLLTLSKYLFNEPLQEYTDISVCKCAVIMDQTVVHHKQGGKSPWST